MEELELTTISIRLDNIEIALCNLFTSLLQHDVGVDTRLLADIADIRDKFESVTYGKPKI